MRKIAITGPESTGKSRLCEELAMHYGDVCVPEYARRYIDRLDRPYVQEDILAIARGQLRREREAARRARRILFCDTELIVTKIWSLHKYGRCDPFILEQIPANRYDLFLLCQTDLPWEEDRQREHPHLRDYFFDWYRRELQEYGFPYVVIHGKESQRLSAAIEAIDQAFPSVWAGCPGG